MASLSVEVGHAWQIIGFGRAAMTHQRLVSRSYEGVDDGAPDETGPTQDDHSHGQILGALRVQLTSPVHDGSSEVPRRFGSPPRAFELAICYKGGPGGFCAFWQTYDLPMVQSTQEALTTAEELLLLAIDPRSGALHSHPTFRLSAALAGAVLLDLFADGSLTLVDDTVVAGANSSNSRYAAAVERIRNLPTAHGVPWWVDAFGYAGLEAKGWTIASLAEKGVIAVDKRPWLPPFPRTRYRLTEPTARSAVASKILARSERIAQPDPQSIVISVMAAECGLVESRPEGRVACAQQEDRCTPAEPAVLRRRHSDR